MIPLMFVRLHLIPILREHRLELRNSLRCVLDPEPAYLAGRLVFYAARDSLKDFL